MKALPKKVHAEVEKLCAAAESSLEAGDKKAAWAQYWAAMDLLPEPQTDWEAATWILSAIGDMLFQKPDYAKARDAFEDAVRCPGGLGNVFIHLRLGQIYYELKDKKRAADELARAYMGGGREVFEGEDPKYLKLVEQTLRPAAGDDRLR